MRVGIKPVLDGPVELVNQKEYPFNDSRTIVRIEDEELAAGYLVSAFVRDADGEVGDIVVDGRCKNGFSLAFTGSARKVEAGILTAPAKLAGAAASEAAPLDLECSAEGTVVAIRNAHTGSEVSIDLDEARDLYDLDLIVYADDAGMLTLGESTRYAAVIHIPAKVYDIEWGVTDEFGFQRMYKHCRPVDMDAVRVELWNEVA